MGSLVRTSVVLLVLLSVLTGGLYPLVVTAIAAIAFSQQAEGSLIRDSGRIVGSELIGQPFSRPEYFWGRLSATPLVPYNAAASGGSNYGPLHPDLKRAAAARLAALQIGGAAGAAVPVDLLTASASGLDPHISPAAAEYQVPRVAAARRMSEADVRALVSRHIAGRQLGVLGEPRVSVLPLNLALDRAQSRQ